VLFQNKKNKIAATLGKKGEISRLEKKEILGPFPRGKREGFYLILHTFFPERKREKRASPFSLEGEEGGVDPLSLRPL